MAMTEDFLKMKSELLSLKDQLEKENNRKIRAEERYSSAKRKLVEVIEKIKKAGYNPATFKADVEALDKEFEGKLASFHASIGDMKSKLDEIEG